MLETVVIVFHLLGALGVVALVLLQQGKGADAGASFGAGASNTVFGGQGTATFLSKFTAILAACFFITSLGLGYFAKEKAHQLTQAGLPDPAVLEVKQKPAADDVPVLEAQKPAVVPADVPPASEQK
ncbi:MULTISPECIES: preprotein translocase subunit SecG [Pseudomonas syringae group]|uniref:Protein-export membrane protein SecG n=4 Tax=Pseudomonas syringae group TaxID=136849 RepID=A0AA40P2N7_9PSED|nr:MULTISPECIES: preprotein translocase subunit SecG [Pseudomonas syringae group]KGS16098.1 preprotein translocase subunit SecG [Pseudomonas coronafaciens]KOP56430.1 preprotein translocase subunit SecG [Pseudomonas coronafaciens pv. porri]KOP57840.1 preprotein translocase subunit SecG [Pseudomonas coronafaciens pv. porri]KPX33796.1 Preprotein translocase subunit SecG [Pseudomonas coronafaciens pv. garcae]KPY05646.1 Preprotein translocase subunit SecG [Pseudomonas coronafaciens pv. oryzae]